MKNYIVEELTESARYTLTETVNKRLEELRNDPSRSNVLVDIKYSTAMTDENFVASALLIYISEPLTNGCSQ